MFGNEVVNILSESMWSACQQSIFVTNSIQWCMRRWRLFEGVEVVSTWVRSDFEKLKRVLTEERIKFKPNAVGNFCYLTVVLNQLEKSEFIQVGV